MGAAMSMNFSDIVKWGLARITSAQRAAGATGVVGVTSAGNAVSQLGREGDLVFGSAASVSSAFVGGSSAWVRLAGPNDFNSAAWSQSAELTTPSAAWSYTTAASAANGPCMSRREGAAIKIDGSVVLANTGAPTFGNIRNFNSIAAAGGLANKTIAILIYAHRPASNGKIVLRVGLNSTNWVQYAFSVGSNMLIEGYNMLLCSTASAIGTQVNGLQDFQSSGVTTVEWAVGAGTFDFSMAVNYMAVSFENLNARTYYWLEGIYTGGKDKPKLTIGFDISNVAGLTTAKGVMDTYGLTGYAAIPTANGSPSTPAYLLSASDVAYLQQLYTAGWDIIQHTVSHNSLGNLTDDGVLVNEFEGCRTQIIAMGTPAGADLFATPNNSISNRVVAIMKRLGMKWSRQGINAPMLLPRGLIGTVNPLMQGAFAFSNQSDTTRTLAFIDLLIQHGASGHIYSHAIVAGASDSLNTNVTVFDAICAGIRSRVNAGQIDVVTPTKFIRDSAPANLAAIFSLPNRLSLTAGASPFDLINTGYSAARYVISGGVVSSIQFSKDGTNFDTLPTAGTFDLSPGDRLRITYTAAPTIIQYGINGG
jgi:hypothetical protein